MTHTPLSWTGIARLGLVQMALGAIVVLTTSTLNRVMVVELALPAMLPGVLVAIHYVVQLLRPRLGYGSDVGGRRTPWIVGGMAVLAVGGIAASCATVLMASHLVLGTLLAVLAFCMIGLGVGAAGTSLLVLLAKRVVPERRAPAATMVWLMMIGGFIITATTAGHLLDPFSPARLVAVTSSVSVLAFIIAWLAIRNVEGDGRPAMADAADIDAADAPAPPFRQALAQVWADADARRFTIFVFISMLAYSAQDLILEPFAGVVFAYTPGESTRLAGLQHGGVLAGMLLVALCAGVARNSWLGSLKNWMVFGCVASGCALLSLVAAGAVGPAWPLKASVFALGVFNGAFSIAAIGSMMRLAGDGPKAREGVRMGLWGAAQAIAFGLGGMAGAGASDLARLLLGSQAAAYASVFFVEGLLFFFAAVLATRITPARTEQPRKAAAKYPGGSMVGT
jgi:BCD family chlorophyll transporter-like MFS transporter